MAKLLTFNQQTEIPFRSSLTSDLLMMHVKVKAKDIKINIPIPYAILNIAISILSSKKFSAKCKQMDKRAPRKKKTELYLSTNRQKNAKAYRQRIEKV